MRVISQMIFLNVLENGGLKIIEGNIGDYGK
jgi:hypothetical protein